MVFGKKKQEAREPDETAVFADIAVGLWSSLDANGRYAIRFSLSRRDDDGKIRRTFRPEHLEQFPYAIAGLAKALAQASRLPQALRNELSQLASVMEKAIELAKSNGLAAESDAPERSQVFG
jgi:hypothetical protein